MLERRFIPAELEEAYRTLIAQLLAKIRSSFEHGFPLLRLHGDCHPGNVLWDEGPNFVDLDDCCMGPAIQDLWMLLSGEREERERQVGWLLDGYFEFAELDPRELALIEPLRTLRMIHHCAWIAQRWSDPAFPAAFPWFGSAAYWSQQTTQLREQLDAMAEPPLRP